MHTIKSQAIVLHRMPYSESSFILKIFTRESGLLSFIAKGAARPKSKFRGLLDFYSVLDIMFKPHKGEGLTLLTDAALGEEFINIKQDLAKQALGSLFLEIFLRHLYGPETSIPLFEVLRHSLDSLDSSRIEKKNYPLMLTDFLLQFSGIMGFRPDFSRCMHCKEDLHGKHYQMDFDMGGPLCKSCCTETGQKSTSWPVRIFNWLNNIQDSGISQGSLSPGDMAKAERILFDFLRVQSSRSQAVNSYRFYRDMVKGK